MTRNPPEDRPDHGLSDDGRRRGAPARARRGLVGYAQADGLRGLVLAPRRPQPRRASRARNLADRRGPGRGSRRAAARTALDRLAGRASGATSWPASQPSASGTSPTSPRPNSTRSRTCRLRPGPRSRGSRNALGSSSKRCRDAAPSTTRSGSPPRRGGPDLTTSQRRRTPTRCGQADTGPRQMAASSPERTPVS